MQLKEEVELLRDEQMLKNEQLIRYEKICAGLQDEVGVTILECQH